MVRLSSKKYIKVSFLVFFKLYIITISGKISLAGSKSNASGLSIPITQYAYNEFCGGCAELETHGKILIITAEKKVKDGEVHLSTSTIVQRNSLKSWERLKLIPYNKSVEKRECIKCRTLKCETPSGTQKVQYIKAP